MTAGFEGFVWPDTGDVDMELSAWDGEPVILYSDYFPRSRPRLPGEHGRSRHWPEPNTRPASRGRVRRAVASGRHALAAAPRHAAVQASRNAVGDWMRWVAGPSGRHAVAPVGRHAALDVSAARSVALAGYLALPVTDLPYRGRRRAEMVAEWRWPALAGSVAGASLAFAVLLAAASPPASHSVAEPPPVGGPDGIVATGNGHLVPAPPCDAPKHAVTDGACGQTRKPPVITAEVYHLAAAATPMLPRAPRPKAPVAAPPVPVTPVAPIAQPPHATQWSGFTPMYPQAYPFTWTSSGFAVPFAMSSGGRHAWPGPGAGFSPRGGFPGRR
jgi:hypothetical protein